MFDMKFSVIIPTMWKSSKIIKSVNDFINCDLVKEIIIINNNISHELPLEFSNKKIILLNQKKNIYVNPSWNLGVEVSSCENLLFVNDDVYVYNSCELLVDFLNGIYDIIGLDVNNSNLISEFTIKDYKGDLPRPPRFFTWFYMKKNNYVTIPENILIWCGDGIQYSSNYNRGIFTSPKLDFEMSVTLRSIENIRSIIYDNDRPNYLKYCEENGIKPL